MFYKYRSWLLMIFDIVVVVLSYFFALWLRYDLSFKDINAFYTLSKLVPALALVSFFMFKVFKMDKTLWRQPSVEEALRVAMAVFFVFVFNAIVIIFLFQSELPRSIHIIALLISVLVIEFSRFMYRIYRHLNSVSSTHNPEYKRTLIVGAGDAGMMLLKEILHNKRYKNNIIGFVDDNEYKKGRIISGYPILGNSQELPTIIQNHDIELVYVAMPSASIKRQNEIIKLCYKQRVEVKILGQSENLISQSDISKNIRPVSISDLLGRKEIELNNFEIADLIRNQVVLVTGAGGSIGSELCRQLVQFHPQSLVMIDVNENSLYDLQAEFNIKKREGKIDKNIGLYSLITSIRDYDSLEQLFDTARPTVVFHAAAHKHVPFMEAMPAEAIKNNIFGTFNLIEIAKKYEVRNFVSISTDKAVNPTNVMGATKRFMEKMIQSLGKDGKTKFVAVRFGNVLGSNGSVVPLFQNQIEKGGPVTVTHKDMVRYFMTIPEAVSLVIQAASYGQGGEVFVLDMGEPVKILDLAEKMIELSGFKPYEDIKIEFTGLRPGEKLFEELLMSEEGLRATPNKLIYVAKPMDISKRLVMNELQLLEDCLKHHVSKHEVLQCLKEVVPTFVPTETS